MREEVKKFVEAYNRNIEWNHEILKGDVNPDDFRDEARYIIRHYLSTKIITEKEYDLGNAKVYYYTDKHPIKSELQVFNLRTASTYYFWCVENMTEEKYKAERLRFVNEELDKRRKEQMEILKTAEGEIESIDKLYKLLNGK